MAVHIEEAINNAAVAMHDSIAASKNVKVVLMAPLPRIRDEMTGAMNSQWDYQNRHDRRKE
jgi:hypothetical protein